MNAADLRVRPLSPADLAALEVFRCRTGGGEAVSMGAFMLLTIFRQMRELGRHRRAFARVDRRNTRSLALCDRIGLTDERRDLHDDMLVQRWGELPA